MSHAGASRSRLSGRSVRSAQGGVSGGGGVSGWCTVETPAISGCFFTSFLDASMLAVLGLVPEYAESICMR